MTHQEIISNLFATYQKEYANTPAGQPYPQWFTDQQIKWIFDLFAEQPTQETDSKEILQEIRQNLEILTSKIAEDKQHGIFYHGKTIASYSFPSGNKLFLSVEGELKVRNVFDEKSTEISYYSNAVASQKAIDFGYHDGDVSGLVDGKLIDENYFCVYMENQHGELIETFEFEDFTAKDYCRIYDEGINFLVACVNEMMNLDN